MFKRMRRVLAAAAVATFGLLITSVTVTPAIPSPSFARCDRFGVYNWGIDYSAWPGWPDRLNWAANKVAETGSRTIRAVLGGSNPYVVNPYGTPECPQPTSSFDYNAYWLANTATSSAYYSLFTSPNFSTYLLTTYSPSDQRSEWVNGFFPGTFLYNTEREQMKQLAITLSVYYPNKRFIILNWEGDNAIRSVPDFATNPSRWTYYVNWLQSRADGVQDAKWLGVGNVFFGIEFNLVRQFSGAACGSGCPAGQPCVNSCVIDFVAGRVRNVDYYSYSSWQSVNVKVGNPGANLMQTLNNDLWTAQNTIQNSLWNNGQFVSISPANFILGEWGFARTIYGECNAARYVQEMVNAVEGPGSFGVSHAIFWQIVDNVWRTQDGASHVLTNTAGGADWLTFGLYRQDDNNPSALYRTKVGDMFRALVRYEPLPAIPFDCPSINPGGIVNGQAGWIPSFNPTSVMSIFGNNLAGFYGPSSVRFLQGDHGPSSCDWRSNQLATVRNGSPWWYESQFQVNASIPPGVTTSGWACGGFDCNGFQKPWINLTGGAQVWVRDARGIDSNGQFININP